MKTTKVIYAIICLLASFHSYASSQITPKYKLNECVAQIEYKWDSQSEIMDAGSVVVESSERLKIEFASGRFPLFVSTYVRDANSLLLFFADKCNERKQLALEIAKSLEDNVSNFPNYTVHIPDIDKENFGVMPSGWWIDD